MIPPGVKTHAYQSAWATVLLILAAMEDEVSGGDVIFCAQVFHTQACRMVFVVLGFDRGPQGVGQIVVQESWECLLQAIHYVPGKVVGVRCCGFVSIENDGNCLVLVVEPGIS
jgi:hypothetical protein